MPFEMKKYPLVFIFLFAASFLSAQQVKWSPVIDDKDYSFVKIIGQSEDGFYVLKSNISFDEERDKVGFRSRKYNISFFTNEMSLKWIHSLDAPLVDGRIITVNIVHEKILVTYAYANKKQKAYNLYVQYLNNNGTYADSAKLIAEVGYDKISDKEKPVIYISQNNNRIVCSFKTIDATNRDVQNCRIHVMDTSLTTIYQKDFTIPFSERQFITQNIIVSNEGGFYLFGIRYLSDKKNQEDEEGFYQLYHCDSPSSEVRVDDIKINQKYITGVALNYDNINHKIVAAGFFSDVNPRAVAGTFYYALRTDTVQPAQVHTSSFDVSFLSKFRGELKENNNRELLNYGINRIILRRDGGAVIIAEGVSTSYTSYYDYFSQMYITHRYYLYGNVMTISLNPDGSIMWGDVITKEQESRDDGAYYSSYCTNIYANKMYFVYNKYIGDHPSVLLSSINSKGEQKTDVLFNEEEKVVMIPLGGKQVAEDELVIPAIREGKLRFVKITF